MASPNDSQHHVIVRGRSENVANEGICRNERVALVFASFSLKKKKKSFPVSYCTKRHPKSQRTKKTQHNHPALSGQTRRTPNPKQLNSRFSFASFLLTQKKRRPPIEEKNLPKNRILSPTPTKIRPPKSTIHFPHPVDTMENQPNMLRFKALRLTPCPATNSPFSGRNFQRKMLRMGRKIIPGKRIFLKWVILTACFFTQQNPACGEPPKRWMIPHRLSKGIFVAPSRPKGLFHPFHSPYYCYCLYTTITTLWEVFT